MASCDKFTHIIAENWLQKKSRHIGVWRKRWTVLTTGTLTCYKQEKIYSNPTLVIKLADIKHIHCGSKSTFNITKHNEDIISFRWKSEFDTVTKQWKQNIEDAIYSIDVPITVICTNNSKLSCQFSIVLKHHKDNNCNLQEIINKIAMNLRKHKVLPIRILSSSYFDREIHLNDDQLTNDSYKISNYDKNIVVTKGIKLEIISLEPHLHFPTILPKTCNRLRYRTETMLDKIKCVVPKQKYIISGFIRQLRSVKLINLFPNEILLLMCIFMDYTEEYSTNNFTKLRCGPQGQINCKSLIVLQKQTQNTFLMKCWKKRFIFQRHIVENMKRERKILADLNHPFIVNLHYAFQTDYELYMVMEFCSGGDIFFWLSKAGRFTEEKTRFYLAEIVIAVDYLHSRNIIHRNLKPENILLHKDGHIKIGDFGLAQDNVTDDTSLHDFCGTPEYIPPEILRRVGHGFPVDWWSVGCLMYEFLSGVPPFYSRSRDALFDKILRQKIRFPNYFSKESIDILKWLLTRNPKYRLGSRYGIEKIKEHVFWKDLNWELLYQRKVQPPFVPNASTWNYDVEWGFPIESIEDNKRKYAPFDGFEFDGNVQIFI